MPTPASGAISMNNMNVEIVRRAGTSQLSMSEIRTRYGGSGQINFSELYNTEGFIVNCGFYSDKFGSFNGWEKIFAIGSVDPNESNGTVQFAANSFLWGASSRPSGSNNASFVMYDTNTTTGTNVTVGFRGVDVTRTVAANVNGSITSSSNSGVSFNYPFPSSGTVHCLIKF
jgi:hypothetical protein